MIPRATYRLQLNRDFGFRAAAELVPYLAELGISHCYLSPYLKARSGSPHGYDIVDHNALDAELGSEEAYRDFVAALREHGMGHILDLVVNHMGVGGDDNHWWMDVLENGRASLYAGFFDIDWYPAKKELRERILVPILAKHYGRVLERGELRLGFDSSSGELSIRYSNHRLPLDPRTYPQVLAAGWKRKVSASHGRDALSELIAAFGHLPGRNETALEKRDMRRDGQRRCKAQLARLYADSKAVATHLDARIAAINVGGERRNAFAELHRLLEAQVYRLAYWRIAADEINYRRFFAINDLAGLCMEKPEVFAATHRLVLQLIESGQLDGLRIDHPDGLYAPTAYFRHLRAVLAPSCYLVAEKILASDEELPMEWPLHGTTGYDFANELNGLYVRPEAAWELERIYRHFSGNRLPFDELLYRNKRLVMEVECFGELDSLGRLLVDLTEGDRQIRDYAANSLRNALKEIIACFPVYRTYLGDGEAGTADRRYIEIAIGAAKRRSPATDISVFDVILDLLLDGWREPDPSRRAAVLHFVKRFQQYTAPITAKALEDTSLYNYNRLLSLNDVGSDPRRFGVTLEEFHASAMRRLRQWPAAMLGSSTHDSKRSEDIRARLNVLSEMPSAWKRQISRWRRVNRRHHYRLAAGNAPSRNDEYLLYQTVLGTWPLEALDEEGLGRYRQRIRDYMLKAIREAKVNTSWLNTNLEYEEAVAQFVERLLEHGDTPFLREFIPFAERVSRLGLYNSLSQTLLKLTSPGVPDLYQGCELWRFNLVDPDNRRPVDYALRRQLLDLVRGGLWESQDDLTDGRAKLYLIRQLLALRQRFPELFALGDYLPLEAEGPRSQHLCSFVRIQAEIALLVVAPRWFVELCGDENRSPVDEDVWADTLLRLPRSLAGREWNNVLTGERIMLSGLELSLVQLLRQLPIGVLFSERTAATREAD